MPKIIKPDAKLERINVLLVNGSTHASKLLEDVLSGLGFSNVQVVNDSSDVIKTLKRRVIHLIVTDGELLVRKKRVPGMEGADTPRPEDLLPISGIEFVKRLRQSPHSPSPFVPVMMVIGKEDEALLRRARDAGVNEIIVKPLAADDICERISGIIDDKRFFITAESYKGPCRRRERKPLPAGIEDRRKTDVRLVRRRELHDNLRGS